MNSRKKAEDFSLVQLNEIKNKQQKNTSVKA